MATPSPQPTSTPNPWQLSPYPVIHFLRETKIHRIDSRSFEILGPDPGAVIHIELTPIDFKPSMVGPDPDMQRFYDSEVKKMKRWGAEFQLLSKTEFIKDSTPFADYFTCKLVYAVAPRRKKEQLGYLLLYSSNIWNLKIDARFPAEKLKKYSKLSELIETRFWLYIFRSGIDYREANASQLVLNFEVSQKDIDGRSSKYKDSASNEYIDLMVDLQK